MGEQSVVDVVSFVQKRFIMSDPDALCNVAVVYTTTHTNACTNRSACICRWIQEQRLVVYFWGGNNLRPCSQALSYKAILDKLDNLEKTGQGLILESIW